MKFKQVLLRLADSAIWFFRGSDFKKWFWKTIF